MFGEAGQLGLTFPLESVQDLVKKTERANWGFDGLNPKVIQQIAPLIRFLFALIFNKSLSKGVVPKNLKCSLISPVYKSEDKSLVSNYRPVSVLPCFSKILEKLMFKRLMSFIDKHKIFTKIRLLLFLLYVNDIHRSSTLLSFILFADDTNIFNSHSDINTLTTTTNEELIKVAEWLRANKLSLNIKKLNSLFSRQETKKQYTLLK